MTPAAVTFLSCGGFLLLLAFYGWLGVRSSRHTILTTGPFAIPDAVCAGILSLWMISVIWQATGSAPVITLGSLVANSAVYLCLIMGILGVIGFRGLSPGEIFGLQPRLFGKAALSGLLWLVITYPLILAAQLLIQKLFGADDDSQQIVHYFLEHPDARHRIAVIVMAVVVAPVAEEIIFRGYLYGVVRRYGGRVPAIMVSSLLFAAIHVHIPSLLGLGVLAVILCLLYERTGSLWATITMHAAFNASTLVMLVLWPEMVA